MKMLYKYPQAAFPYGDLVAENRRRGFLDFEYELLDSGVFNDNRYFDIVIEYAKADEEDILIKITAVNRGLEAAECYLLPTLWFRNTWSWGYPAGPMGDVPGKPCLRQISGPKGAAAVEANHPAAGVYYLYAQDSPDLLFTENETNAERLYNLPNSGPYVKDAFHRCLVNGEVEAVNADHQGTKVAALYSGSILGGGSRTVCLRLTRIYDLRLTIYRTLKS
jgi:hypothetical protein